MKLAGKKLSGPNVEEVFIPRKEGTIVFIAQGITDDSDFFKLCPEPQPPEVMRPGIGKSKNVEDPIYQAAMMDWGSRKFAWMVIQSLKATETLEWEKVKFEDPNTWKLWQEELKEAGFTDPEIKRILMAVMSANGLNEQRIEEARKSFLAGVGTPLNGSFSPKIEQQNMPSGEPVKGSE